ncbi:MAG: hypothetical protein GY731_11500, partial [Gammaproteobacteria bacterium]|nr:hypothetical protein [Gammaproteobacteria bacterium]
IPFIFIGVIEFSMSIVLDDLISFLLAGIVNLTLAAIIVLLGPESARISVAALAGAYYGMTLCLLFVFGVFDLFKGKHPIGKVLLFDAFVVVLIGLFAYIAYMLGSLLETVSLFPMLLLIIGVSWLVFSINGLMSWLRSPVIVVTFLVVSAIPIAITLMVYPHHVLLGNDRLISWFFSVAFVIGFLLSIPLNYAGRRIGNSSKVDVERKIIEPTLMKQAVQLTWFWCGIVVLLAWFFGYQFHGLDESMPVLTGFIALLPIVVSVVFKTMKMKKHGIGITI